MAYVDRGDAWVLFDNRGGGRTGMPSGPVSIPAMAADVLDGSIEPGKLFDRTVDLDGDPDGYPAMADREALKMLATP